MNQIMNQITITPQEQKQLETYIEEVRENEHSAMRFAKSLLALQQSNLWKSETENWAAFCENHFAFTKDQAYRYVRAARYQIEDEKMAERLGLPEPEDRGVDAAIRKAKPAKVCTPHTADSLHNSVKSNSSKKAPVRVDVSQPVVFTKPPALPTSLRDLVDVIHKDLLRLFHRGDLTYESLNDLKATIHKVETARHMLQGVLPGMEDIASKPKFRPPSVEDVQLYAEKHGICGSDADWFWHHMDGQGWKNNGRPVVSWQSLMISWKGSNVYPSLKTVNGYGRQIPKPKTIIQQDMDRLKASMSRL